MPLYTSNSNKRLPEAPYLLQWGLILLICFTMLIGSEFYWRNKSFLPSVTDDLDLWSYWRSKIYSNEKQKSLVIIGASRAQLGLAPKVIEKKLPNFNVVMLAIDGANPYSTLNHLAADEDFNGIALCVFKTDAMFETDDVSQKKWCDYYDSHWRTLTKYGKRIEVYLRVFLQNHIVLLNSDLLFKRQVSHIFKLNPSYIRMTSNRYRPALYYTRMTEGQLKEHKNKRIEKAYTSYLKKKHYSIKVFHFKLREHIAPLVKEIKGRGGDVVFLRMPTEPLNLYKINTIDRYPKNLFWDSIYDYTGAKTIHYEDYSELSNFICPDISHLDAEDAKIFSAAIAQILNQTLYES